MPSAKQMTVYLTTTEKGIKLHRLSRLSKYVYLYLINVELSRYSCTHKGGTVNLIYLYITSNINCVMY